MKNTFKPNDKIITTKLFYTSPLSKLFSVFGIVEFPKRFDILVFSIAPEDKEKHVKRCIGMPGEIIQIDSGVVVVNGAIIQDLPSICHMYKIWYLNFDSLKESMVELSIDYNEIVQRYPKYILLNLDHFQKDKLLTNRAIDSISILKLDDQISHSIFSLYHLGVSDNMKKMRIPYRGMSIKLDSNAVSSYTELLKRFENTILEYKMGNFYINGIKRENYEFKNDYYFLMGDNRDNSLDSRLFGLIPKDYIDGRVIFKF